MKYSFSRSKKSFDNKWRLLIVFSCLIFLLLILCYRIVRLSIFERQFLVHQGNARTLRNITLSAHRGMILDRNGSPLAISTPVYAVWADPHHFDSKSEKINVLAALLGETPNSIQAKIKTHAHSDFIYLERLLPPKQAEKIAALKIKGVYLQKNYHRYYPDGAVLAPLLGFTNIDDQGQEGIELAYNSTLEGVSGSEEVLQDLYGNVVAVKKITKPVRPGKNLTLSIDRSIQYLAYSSLLEVVKSSHAQSGAMVVVNVQTGELLAVVSVPAFNPNARNKHRNDNYSNRAIVDMFEPGSTMKTFAVINALKSGRYSPNTLVDTNPGWMILDGYRVHDERNLGEITLTQILQHSSNMGISRVTLSLPRNSLWQTLTQFGFGQSTQSNFPGEAFGYLPLHAKWSDISLATMSFGYGLSVTALQLARAYSIIADHGVDHPLTLIKVNRPSQGVNIINKHIANQVVLMLQSVIEKGGTATAAHIPGYKVAGKTGTAWILGKKGYESNHFRAVFAGMVPASNPRLVGIVVIKNPQGDLHQGGQIAAPVFAKVMARALQELDVPPDDKISGTNS